MSISANRSRKGYRTKNNWSLEDETLEADEKDAIRVIRAIASIDELIIPFKSALKTTLYTNL